MNCYHCETDLIWGGDHDSDSDNFFIETNLSCPNCGAAVIVNWGEKPKEDENHG